MIWTFHCLLWARCINHQANDLKTKSISHYHNILNYRPGTFVKLATRSNSKLPQRIRKAISLRRRLSIEEFPELHKKTQSYRQNINAVSWCHQYIHLFITIYHIYLFIYLYLLIKYYYYLLNIYSKFWNAYKQFFYFIQNHFDVWNKFPTHFGIYFIIILFFIYLCFLLHVH